MSVTRPLVLAVKLLLAVSVVLGGGLATGVLAAPSVTAENRFAAVDEQVTTVATDVAVSNPYPVALPLDGVGIRYDVIAAGVHLASGAWDGAGVGPGDSSLVFEIRIDNERIPEWWRAHVAAGERSQVTGSVVVDIPVGDHVLRVTPVRETVETDVLSAFDSTEARTLSIDGVGVAGPTLVVRETRASWGTVTGTTTPIEMTFVLENPNPYPIPLSEVGYDVQMNGVPVGSGTTDDAVVIPARGTRTVTATTVVRTEQLDEWWVTHVRNDQATTVAIDYRLHLDLSSVGLGTVAVPVDTMESTFETDFFGSDGTGGANATRISSNLI